MVSSNGTVSINTLIIEEDGSTVIESGTVYIDYVEVNDITDLSILSGNVTIGKLVVVNASSNDTFVIEGGFVSIAESNVSITNSSGELSPGSSPGLLDIAGDYVQEATGTLVIEIEGTAFDIDTESYEYDRLSVEDDRSLDGTLEIENNDSVYSLKQDDEFSIITWNGTISGEFETIITPSLSIANAEWYLGDLYENGTIKVIGSTSSISGMPSEYKATEDETLVLTQGTENTNLVAADNNGYEIVTYNISQVSFGSATVNGPEIEYSPSENMNYNLDGYDYIYYTAINEYDESEGYY